MASTMRWRARTRHASVLARPINIQIKLEPKKSTNATCGSVRVGSGRIGSKGHWLRRRQRTGRYCTEEHKSLAGPEPNERRRMRRRVTRVRHVVLWNIYFWKCVTPHVPYARLSGLSEFLSDNELKIIPQGCRRRRSGNRADEHNANKRG